VDDVFIFVNIFYNKGKFCEMLLHLQQLKHNNKIIRSSYIPTHVININPYKKLTNKIEIWMINKKIKNLLLTIQLILKQSSWDPS
jgi:hypothetical protein